MGRNSAATLGATARSLLALRTVGVDPEIVYVDSASEDGSVPLAKEFADHVLVIGDSPNLSASAGRYLGTLKCSRDWVLYLDSDMLLREEFREVIRDVCLTDVRHSGFVGLYRYVYDDGTARDDALGASKHGEDALTFGGAVLLRRRDVLAAGNWNPRLFANEEVELYTRLRACGYSIKSVRVPMIDHYTQRVSRWRVLLGNFFPSGWLGKKFYGAGQVMAARLDERSVGSLIRYFPYPFVLWGAILLGVLAMSVGWYTVGAMAVALGVAYVAHRKGVKFVVLYVAFLWQVLLGFARYDGSFVPTVVATWSRVAARK